MAKHIHKLQLSKHKNYERYHFSIPVSIVRSLNWEKGTPVKVSLSSVDGDIKVVLSKANENELIY